MGDSLVSGSLELRVPLTSPLNFGRSGSARSWMPAIVYDEGLCHPEQPWQRGIGGSVWFTAAVVRINLSVAHGVGASTRVQVLGNLAY